MTFAHPGFLWLLPIVPLLARWWSWRRQSAYRLSDLGLFGGVTGARAWVARWAGVCLRSLAICALILACAGPRQPDLRTRIPAEGVAIILALDVSGSMATRDVVWDEGTPALSRLDAAKRAFHLFVAGGTAPDGTRFEPRASDPIGLITFAAVSQTPCPLTLNHSVLLQVVDRLQPKGELDAGTNVGDAIGLGVIRLDSAPVRKKVLILLSDGEHNVFKQGENNPLLPLEAAQLAANLSMPIYTIDAGGEPTAAASIEEVQQRRAGQEAMREIAQRTGGKSFVATSGSQLAAAYQEIDALEKDSVVSYQYRRYFEYYSWCAAFALILFTVAHLLDQTILRVGP